MAKQNCILQISVGSSDASTLTVANRNYNEKVCKVRQDTVISVICLQSIQFDQSDLTENMPPAAHFSIGSTDCQQVQSLSLDEK